METILQYLFSLCKRLVFLGIVCAAAPLALTAYGYPKETALEVYATLYAICFPWLLWFQQMYYLGIGRSLKGFVHIRTAFFSSLFCTVLVFFLFPFIPLAGNFSLENIPPQPSLSQNNILSFPEGSLVLQPASALPEAQLPPSAAAVWFGGRKLIFTNISTNGETLVLEGAENLQVPFRKDYPQLNSSLLGRRAASLWLDNMLDFHRRLENFSLSYGAVYPPRENAAFAKVFPQETKPLPGAHPEWDAYARLFLAVFGLYLFACLLGIIFSIRQHYLGALSIICMVCWGGSGYILGALRQLSYLAPFRYIFEAGLCLGSLLLIGIFCGFNIDLSRWKGLRLFKKGGEK